MDQDKELRPSCNCKKTTCLKRYCQCFQGEFFCSYACNCMGCWNREDRRTFVEEHAELRLNTKSGLLSKDFVVTGEKRLHVKGCTCNKSGCKKNYCECFKKKVACTTRCKCQGCENSHGTGGKGLQENGDPSGPSGNPNEAPGSDGSPGGSNESAVVADEELPGPTEAGVAENVTAIANSQDSGTHIHEVGWHSLPPQWSLQAAVLHDTQTPHCRVPSTTHETPVTTTRRVPMQVEIDRTDQLQNICSMYD